MDCEDIANVKVTRWKSRGHVVGWMVVVTVVNTDYIRRLFVKKSERETIGDVIRGELRMIDKLGFNSPMADASRHRPCKKPHKPTREVYGEPMTAEQVAPKRSRKKEKTVRNSLETPTKLRTAIREKVTVLVEVFSMSRFYVGSDAVIESKFFNDANQPVDPDGITVNITSPAGVATSQSYPGTVVRVSEGVFRTTVDCTEFGLCSDSSNGTTSNT